MKEGFIVINKPKGMTSHDVVSVIRKKFNMRRVGHAGTLDPLATGVLILLLGKATKLFEEFSSFDKAYEATLSLGMITDTADINGKVLKRFPYEHITREKIYETFKRFVGPIEQVPPMVSAIKIKGKRLYKLARSGIEIKREPRPITIKELHITNLSMPDVKFYVECSKGTYVRKIAEDIGEVLGCGGCISQINRTMVGPFNISESVKLDEVNYDHLKQWRDMK